ncbi:MAG: AMP-binding protein, partial [Pseudomonadota bacterium]
MTGKATAHNPDFDTFPKLLLRNASTYATRTAIRHKDYGIWQTWSWADVEREVERFALGLQALGLTAGDKVAIIGSNRPRLYWTFAAAQSLGAIPVPVYQDAVAEEMVYVLDHAEVTLAVVEDQEQVDKVLSISDRLPSIKNIVYDEERGLKDYDHGHLKSFVDVQTMGDKAVEQEPGLAQKWRDGIKATKGTDT